MKQFCCGAVIPGCQAKFTGEDEQAILVQLAEHAARDHGLREIPPSVVAQLREHAVDARSTVLALAEPYHPARATNSDGELEALFRDSAALQWLPLLDGGTRPIALATRFGADEIVRRAAMCVLGATPVRDALARALTRLASARFDPLLCCDELGHYHGVIRVERMMEAVLGEPR